MERMGLRGEDEEEEEWAAKIKRRRSQLHHSWKEEEHPGCELSGHLLVDRVPVSPEQKMFPPNAETIGRAHV